MPRLLPQTATTLVRPVCCVLCFSLILTTIPVVPGVGKATSSGKLNAQLIQTPPGSNLPNLDDLRQMRPGTAKAPRPVPATKCRRIDEACKRIKGEISTNTFPSDRDARLFAQSLKKSWMDYFDGSGSDLWRMLNNPSLDISIDGAERAVSDLPVMLSPSSTKTAAGLMFQTESDLAMAQLDPRNRKGTSGEDLLSRNFNWGLSLLNLPGRAGLDVNLGLSLNSLLYTRVGPEVVTDDAAWVEDSLPPGAVPGSDGGDGWTWVNSGFSPYSGAAYHQSALSAGGHQHYFYGVTQTLQINAGDRLYAYIYLDPASLPSEVMLQWNENGSWEHRATGGRISFHLEQMGQRVGGLWEHYLQPDNGYDWRCRQA